MSADEPLDTEQLLARIQSGDRVALDALYARYLPRLCRWASGRLPAHARDVGDTHDLVQDALLNTYRQIQNFDYRGQGAFLGYVRRAILNKVSNEIRRVRRRPAADALADDYHHDAPSPLEQLLGREALDRYDRALQALSESDRTAIIARLELGSSYGEVAAMLGKSNETAARKALERAVKRLVTQISRGA